MLASIGYHYDKPHSTYGVLKNFKNFYPNSTSIIINDGGSVHLKEIANIFQAEYIESRNLGVGNHLDDIEVMIEWIERYFKAIEHVKEPYFINLEDDILITRPLTFTHLEGEIIGLNENARLPEKVTSYLKQFHSDIQDMRAIYSATGGCIFRTDFFKNIAQEDWKKEIYKYAELSKRFSKTEQSWYHNDCCVSFLCLRYGGKIVQNPEYCDLNVHYFNENAAIYHHHHRFSTNHISPYQ
uniref:Glycosyltransferase n=1 Tax=viral metagenome TaxID=1070528 RepID=A0A6C0CSN2_9ZZZZ